MCMYEPKCRYTSLTQLSSCLEASTEGLNQRFNQAAVQFLQHIKEEVLINVVLSPNCIY